MAKPGAVLSSFAAPSTTTAGIAWDGHSIWLAATVPAATIYQLDPRNGNILQSFPAPATSHIGMAWDGKDLWVSSYNTNLVYRVAV